MIQVKLHYIIQFKFNIRLEFDICLEFVFDSKLEVFVRIRFELKKSHFYTPNRYSQKYGHDYNELFTPVAKQVTQRPTYTLSNNTCTVACLKRRQ